MVMEKLTIAKLLQKSIDMLEKGDYNNPLLDAQLLLCYTLNVDKIYIYTHKDEQIDAEAVDKFLKLIKKRSQGYPLQYILGTQEFMGLDFFVKEGVLIPRPDTETLVEHIINVVKSGYFGEKKTINIVDIGAGSGAITLSLAHYLDNAHVYSIDISDSALEVTDINRKRLKLESRVELLKGDLLEPLDFLSLYGMIDIIVSNPPYIPSKEIGTLQTEVAEYEPRLALDGGDDGLDYYRRIVSESIPYLSEKGVIAFEIGYNQGSEVKQLLNNSGYFKRIEIKKDLSGHDRVVTGYRH